MLAIEPSTKDARLERALEELGFSEPARLLSRAMGTLSSGQRRRVQLARAFALDRPVLVLDEPEAGLDAASQRRVRDLVAAASRDKIVIVATHSDLFEQGVRLPSASVVTNEPAQLGGGSRDRLLVGASSELSSEHLE